MGTCNIRFLFFFPSVCVEIMYVLLLLLLDSDEILELCEVKQPNAVCSMA